MTTLSSSAPDNKTLTIYRRLASLPMGKWLFSRGVCQKAPYFSTINPLVTELDRNRSVVTMKKRHAVENHIGTVHVIAVCNLCEVAMGVMAEASIPPHLRWIPKGMKVDYLAKTTTDLKAVCEVKPEDWQVGDMIVPVHVYDLHGKEVLQAEITLWITEKNPA